LPDLIVVVQFGNCFLYHCHSEPVLSARNLLLAGKTADSSRDTTALGMTILNKYSYSTTIESCLRRTHRRPFWAITMAME
jgi:hypothetical protein